MYLGFDRPHTFGTGFIGRTDSEQKIQIYSFKIQDSSKPIIPTNYASINPTFPDNHKLHAQPNVENVICSRSKVGCE